MGYYATIKKSGERYTSWLWRISIRCWYWKEPYIEKCVFACISFCSCKIMAKKTLFVVCMYTLILICLSMLDFMTGKNLGGYILLWYIQRSPIVFIVYSFEILSLCHVVKPGAWNKIRVLRKKLKWMYINICQYLNAIKHFFFQNSLRH